MQKVLNAHDHGAAPPAPPANICDLTAGDSGCSLNRRPTARRLIVMALEARLRELGARHQSLEKAIQDEMRRPSTDEMRLKELKRQKLKLKDELEALKATAH
jgi:hypothetical protein